MMRLLHRLRERLVGHVADTLEDGLLSCNLFLVLSQRDRIRAAS
jgi:hypothetical protein